MKFSLIKPRMERLGNIYRLCIVFVALGILHGCAGTQAFREGNVLLAEGKTEAGLAKLQEAVQYEPKNAEYRIALATRRTSITNKLIGFFDSARREDRLSDAENALQQVLKLDPENVMAKQGLSALAMDRRHLEIVKDGTEQFEKKGVAAATDIVERLRVVLAENPSRKDAFALKARIEAARSSVQRQAATLSNAFKKPISLEFQDAPFKSVIDLMAQVSGLNFFLDNDVRPDLKVSVNTKGSSIEDVLHLLLTTNQLKQKILNDNSILIYPGTPQKIKDYQTMVVRSFFLANADVKAVSNTLKTILKIQDLVVDERLGIIIIRDTPDVIRMAERIVTLQDLTDPEVMLEVEIMEIKRSRLLELGVQWPSQLSLSPLQAGTTPLTLQALRDLNASTIQATVGGVNINARKEDQDTNILANPRIRVRNKEKAKVLIGDRIPVITTTSTSTGFVAESVNYIDVGLKLEVEPIIYLDEDVAIKINLEVSSLVKEILSKAGSLSYQIGTRGANTVLRLKNGETQILAGLISDEDRSTANKVPGLGELPVLGRLFGSQKDDGQRSEILLSITPRVVRSLQRPDLFSSEFDSGTDSNIGNKPLSISPIIDNPDVSLPEQTKVRVQP